MCSEGMEVIHERKASGWEASLRRKSRGLENSEEGGVFLNKL